MQFRKSGTGFNYIKRNGTNICKEETTKQKGSFLIVNALHSLADSFTMASSFLLQDSFFKGDGHYW